MTGIRTVVVGIPARNERDRIVDSIASVLRAIGGIDPAIRAVVVVACDSCDDDTADLLDRMRSAAPELHVARGSWGSAGGARRAAIASGLALVADADPASVWIATTDADTVVPTDWLATHLRHAAAGADAVAGIVELIVDEDHTADTILAFAKIYEMTDPSSHHHVHGANLGIRAAAYLRAGGFPEVACSEDHALWNRLRDLAYRCVSPRDVRVSTSARLLSRAPGGFATTLAAAL